MKTIVVTYPYFQSLPKGVKMMLVESEGFFFREANSGNRPAARGTRMDRSRFGLMSAEFGMGTPKNTKGLPGEQAFPE